MGGLNCCCCACVDHASVGVVEKWGRFLKLATPGLHFFNPFRGECLAGVLSTRLCSLDVCVETKTKDNVFVQIVCSTQYRIIKEFADDAFYELQNPKEQIRSYVFDVVRAQVPRIALDELFEQKGEVAKAVLDELEKVMRAYGYSIEQILMVDIIPDTSVRKAMNEINAAHRLQLASVYKGEAEKILMVKKAEAEAEAKHLAGIGVAKQRQAITDGLRDNVLNFSHNVEEAEKILMVKKAEAEAEAKHLAGIRVAKQRQAITDGLRDYVLNFSHNVQGTSAKEVMDLIMVTQYFDTIKDLGDSSSRTTVFVPHGPGHVRDISEQIRNGVMEAQQM